MLKQGQVLYVLLLAITFILGGCAGSQTFSPTARAGDTTIVMSEWKNFYRNNITITITDSLGVPTILPPNDPAIRAVVNLYPDPVSSMNVSRATNQNLTPYASTYATTITSGYTGKYLDWWNSAVFIDLPASLSVGIATIEISNPEGQAVTSDVNIIDSGGEANTFSTEAGDLDSFKLRAMERVPHYVVTYNKFTNVPYAMQLDMTHDPDVDMGGIGKAHVINPRGDVTSVTWSDDGTNLRIIIIPSNGQVLENIKHFRFYVAGGITGLTLQDVNAFDIDGNPITGIIPAIDVGG